MEQLLYINQSIPGCSGLENINQIAGNQLLHELMANGKICYNPSAEPRYKWFDLHAVGSHF
jgi:hypothetical protein